MNHTRVMLGMIETFSMFAFLITGLTTVYLYYSLKNTKEELVKKEKAYSQQLFELTILKEISDKIGYTVKINDVARTLAETIQRLFHVSSVSFILIEGDTLELTTLTKEKVGQEYISGVKEIMLQSVYEIDSKLKSNAIIEKSGGEHISEDNDQLIDVAIHNDAFPKSYFNIPLVINNKFLGIINISSSQEKAYEDEDMSLLYKIINRAQLLIGRLETVIDTEKGKVEALIKSLSSGAMFFTIQEGSLRLFTINNAAKRFLKLEGEVDLVQILTSFRLKPNLMTEMKEVILKKKSTIYRNIEMDGRHYNIYITPVFSANSEFVIGVALTMQDITVEKEIDKTRDSFVNMMVHELRAPLTAIKGASALLLNEKLELNDEIKLKRILNESTERILNDINELLDTAKIDVGKMTIVVQQADINSIIEKQLENFSYEAHNRGISLDKHLDVHIPAFAFDTVRIEQVLGNLISNSLKFGKNGGKIDISTYQKGNEVVVSVKDNGIGIEEDKIKTLFKPFSQVTNIHRRRGTGLGLYISKAIVEGHGGKISVDSKFEQGTTVSFSLPLIKVYERSEENKDHRVLN